MSDPVCLPLWAVVVGGAAVAGWFLGALWLGWLLVTAPPDPVQESRR